MSGSCSEPRHRRSSTSSARSGSRKAKGLAGWAVEHREPVFVPEGLLSDPRVKVVPELEEERYQSLVSVPLLDKEGSVIGVISAHSEAPTGAVT